MNIGLTYDLRSEYLALGYSEDETAEFDRDDTVEAIEAALQRLGHKTFRIGNIRQLASALVSGEQWDLVFNIAEGMRGIGREAQVPCLLDAYDIPYTFSDPLVMCLTLDKAMTKAVLRDAGVATSAAITVNNGVIVADLQIPFPLPWFIKPLSEGTGKGIGPESIIRQKSDLAPAVSRLLTTYRQPVIIEPYLSGREFTTAIIGTGHDARVLGSMEVVLREEAEQGVYSYTNKENCEELVEYRLVSDEEDVVARAEKTALEAWRVLGCRDAGRIDLRCDDRGTPQFIEVNPLAGIHPEHSDLPIICNKTGFAYDDLIKAIVESASGRIKS